VRSGNKKKEKKLVCDVMVGLEEEKFGKRRRKLHQRSKHNTEKGPQTPTNHPFYHFFTLPLSSLARLFHLPFQFNFFFF